MSSSSACRSQVEETMVMMQQKQGIVTILGDTNTPSLRRALSADMSSNKWLSHQNMMKKIPSSEQLLHSSIKTIADSLSSSSSSSEDEAELAEAEAERERLEIWSSIQRNKKEEQEKAAGGGAFDMWTSLVSLKDNNNEISKSLPASPYIHPLVKRSKSCLSEKSLEICTESLGSETGSDGLFPSYPPSDTGDADHEDHKEEEQEEKEEEKVTEEAEAEEEPRYNHGATKKIPPRSFPPPLPSLSSRQTAGPSLHMRSRRDNGRLVLEAVSVPSQNNFCVQRQDGRLVLTFANHHEETKEEYGDEVVAENDHDGLDLEEEFEEEEFGAGFEEEEHEEDIDEEDEAEDDVESVIEKAPLKLCSEITTTNSVGSLALMMNKPIGLVNRNPKWSEKFNEVDAVETGPLAQSLPPRVPRLIPSTASTAAASFNFNAYEYFWRTKPTSKDATLPHSLAHKNHNNTYSTLNNNSTSKLIVSGDLKHVSNERQQLLVLRGKNGDYMVHNLESCKDSRRSFLFWEPYCIAT